MQSTVPQIIINLAWFKSSVIYLFQVISSVHSGHRANIFSAKFLPNSRDSHVSHVVCVNIHYLLLGCVSRRGARALIDGYSCILV